jgi:hypothetical protein
MAKRANCSPFWIWCRQRKLNGRKMAGSFPWRRRRSPRAIDALRPEIDAEIRAEQEKRLPLLGAAEARIGKVSARGAPGRLKS